MSLRVTDRKRGCFEEEFQVAEIYLDPTFNLSPAKQGLKRNQLLPAEATVSLP